VPAKAGRLCAQRRARLPFFFFFPLFSFSPCCLFRAPTRLTKAYRINKRYVPFFFFSPFPLVAGIFCSFTERWASGELDFSFLFSLSQCVAVFYNRIFLYGERISLFFFLFFFFFFPPSFLWRAFLLERGLFDQAIAELGGKFFFFFFSPLSRGESSPHSSARPASVERQTFFFSFFPSPSSLVSSRGSLRLAADVRGATTSHFFFLFFFFSLHTRRDEVKNAA